MVEKFTAYDDGRHDMIEAMRETQQKNRRRTGRKQRADVEDGRPSDTAPALSPASNR
jgi:hypothetical protein